jgi:hypothetical protein
LKVLSVWILQWVKLVLLSNGVKGGSAFLGAKFLRIRGTWS